jgi:hypothetical protein
MADSKLRVNLIGDASSLSRSLQIATKRLDAFGQRATQIGKDLSLRLTLPIGLAAGAAIKMASDMEESTNKVRVAFGDSSKEVEAFAKTSLRSFGIAESSALDMTALFGDMATGMGVSRSEASVLSTSLVGLAGDLASFKNINIEEVTTALSGVFTGETESLKRLGIVMTEVNLEQFALQQGIQKSIKDMTQQEKILLRLQYIFSVTGNAQGDFARTSEAAANQMRIFTESIKELGADLGSVMLPSFTKAITKLNELLDEFRGLDDQTKKTIVQLGLVVAAVPPLIYVLGQLAISFSALSTAILKIPKAMLAFTAALSLGLVALDQISNKLAPTLNLFERFGIILKFMGQPHMIAPMLKLHDGIKKVEEAQRALNKEAEKTADAPPAAATTLQAPVFKETVDQESLALKQMAADANAASEALDEMLRVDPTLQFALAADTAAVELFGNVVKQTAEDVRTPMEAIKEQTRELSEGAVAFLNQVGRALQSAFNQMFEGEDVLKSLGDAILVLIKQLAAAAAAAAVVALIISSITGVPFSKSFGAVFSGFTGINAAASPQGIPGANTPSPFNQPQVNISGQFRLDGQDLVLAVQRAQNTRNSFT